MECRASLVSCYLLLPGLDPDEVRRGQLLTLLAGLSVLLAPQLLFVLAKAVL